LPAALMAYVRSDRHLAIHVRAIPPSHDRLLEPEQGLLDEGVCSSANVHCREHGLGDDRCILNEARDPLGPKHCHCMLWYIGSAAVASQAFDRQGVETDRQSRSRKARQQLRMGFLESWSVSRSDAGRDRPLCLAWLGVSTSRRAHRSSIRLFAQGRPRSRSKRGRSM
jgi:hypothetical protein